MRNAVRARYDGAVRNAMVAIRHGLLEVCVALVLVVSGLALDAVAVDLEDASPLQLCMEMAHRGLDRWGCWDEQTVVASWCPPASGGPVSWYELRTEARGVQGVLQHLERYIAASPDSLGRINWPTFWPAWVDSVHAQVRAVGSGGPGVWSTPGQWWVRGQPTGARIACEGVAP